MPKEIVLEIHCLGCGELVTPRDVNWLVMRTGGIYIHNTARCTDKAYAKLYGKEENSSKNTP